MGTFVAGLFFKAKDAYLKFKGERMDSGISTAAAGKLYEFTMRTIDGKEKPLADYKGKVLLIVNVASRCGFTPQYDGLERLYKQFKDRGFQILAFPANEFGAQEPGSDSQIKQFCSTKFNVTFDLFSKIVVKGPSMHPLYGFLTTESGFNGDIPWNFSKFVADKSGKIVARFGPDVEPESSKLVKTIESLLGTPKKSPPAKRPGG